MNHCLFILLVATALVMHPGCKKDKSPAPATSPQLRIYNATGAFFRNCTVDPAGTMSDNPGANAYEFGDIPPLGKTSYKSFSTLYRYAWLRLTMNGNTYYIKPYDYMGETPLANGYYTYKLTYTSGDDQLHLGLIED